MSKELDNNILRKTISDVISDEEALARIKADADSYERYLSMKPDFQKMIVDILAGRVFLKATYDKIFKKIFDPDAHRGRLEAFVSSILGFDIHIERILRNEGIMLHEKASFVVMDIICKDDKGSVINVEMQKLGYDFPGERASCYNADMIMREYNDLREELKDEFSYRKMKPVYLIILMEESSNNFLSVSPQYFHQMKHICSSGAEVSELSNTIYISLDTFNKTNQNIITDRDAWLTLLSTTSTKKIVKLIEQHPEFQEIYEEIAKFRANPKELIGMVSEMIATLDHNTIMYMVDEWKAEIKQQKAEIKQQKAEIEQQKEVIKQKDAEIEDLRAQLKALTED